MNLALSGLLHANTRMVKHMIAESADVAASAKVANSAAIWDLVQVREDAQIGEGVILGRGAYIGNGVVVGANCKIQNYALVYEPAVLEEGVFVGPAAVLTNDREPRAIVPSGERKAASDWHAVGVTVRRGASIGARAVCIAPVEIGEWAMVAAGAVVTKPVAAFALVMGVPAVQVGWVGRAGVKLLPVEGSAGLFECPQTGLQYVVDAQGHLGEL